MVGFVLFGLAFQNNSAVLSSAVLSDVSPSETSRAAESGNLPRSRRREGRKSFKRGVIARSTAQNLPRTNSTSLPSDKAEPLSACDAMINHRGTRQVDVKAERDTLAPGKLDSRKGA